MNKTRRRLARKRRRARPVWQPIEVSIRITWSVEPKDLDHVFDPIIAAAHRSEKRLANTDEGAPA